MHQNFDLREKKSRKVIFKIFIYLSILLIINFFIFSAQILTSNPSSTSWMNKIPILSQIKHLAESANFNLKGEDRDRINILLLGVGGKNHDGAWLTDTIMVASIEPKEKKVALLSIPRDLTIPIEGMGWRKINSVDSFAEQQNPGSGGEATSQAVSHLLNIPIDYYFRVDFTGFQKIIDELGGVDVYVDNTLDDYDYPVLGMEDAYPYSARYEHLHVDKGLQHMDGSLALKFARSRHGVGSEGSDFARAKRQQKIIEAVKAKLLSMNVLFEPRTVSNIISDVNDNISTDLKIGEIVRLWDLLKDVQKENIINKVLDNSPNGLLVDGRGDDGAYILTPRSGDFSEIQYLANNIFGEVPKNDTRDLANEDATVEIRNGTWINGLASRVAVDLENDGFDVVRIANSSRKNFQKSVIYDLTYGEKMKSLASLKDKTGANVSYGLPQWLIDEVAADEKAGKSLKQPDFILVLGQEADNNSSSSDTTTN